MDDTTNEAETGPGRPRGSRDRTQRASPSRGKPNVTVAIRAAAAAGMDLAKVEIAPDGRVTLIARGAGVPDEAEPNPFDHLLQPKAGG